jgi:hypothetical protein
VKLSRLFVVLLLALGLLGGGFVVAPDVAADTDCKEHCDDKKHHEEPAEEVPAVVIVGGTVTSSTTLDLTADGGTGIADASGGDFNTAIVNDGGALDGDDVAAAGNGGTATASANGGAIVVGNVNSGGNSGNTITVGNTNVGEVKKVEEPKKVVEVVEKKVSAPKPSGGEKKAEEAKKVKGLPSTGVGTVAGQTGTNGALIALALLGVLAAAGYGLRRRFV